MLDDGEVRRVIAAGRGRQAAARPRASRRARRRDLSRSPRRRTRPCWRCSPCCVERLFKRLFTRIDVHGLEPVVEAAKLPPARARAEPPLALRLPDPVVALLRATTWCRRRSPRGINLAFWPFGPIFRRAGAFFLRRSFDGDPLYKAVFRGYVQHLMQGRRHAGVLHRGHALAHGQDAARRGSACCAWCSRPTARRAPRPVPRADRLHLRAAGRGGLDHRRARRRAQAARVAASALLRAHTVLRHRYGSVTRPLRRADLARAAPGRHRSASHWAPGRIPDLRGGHGRVRRRDLAPHQRLDHGRTLVGRGRRAARSARERASRGRAARARVRGRRAARAARVCRVSESLERCLASGRPEAAVELLEQAERVKRVASPRGDLLQIADGMRVSLDLYRASIGHALVWPAVLALELRGPCAREALFARASALARALLPDEYFPVGGEARRERLERVLAHLVARGWVESATPADALRPTEAGEPWLAFLRAQLQPLLECYATVARAAVEAKGTGEREALLAAREGAAEGGAARRRAPLPRGPVPDLGRERARAAPARADPGRRREGRAGRCELRAGRGVRGARGASRASGSGGGPPIESRAMALGVKRSKEGTQVLRFGFPKGSLQDMTASLFERAGYRMSFPERSLYPDDRRSRDRVRADPRAGGRPLRGRGRARRGHHRLRLDAGEQVAPARAGRSALLEDELPPDALGARRAGGLADQGREGPRGQAHRDRGRRPGEELAQEARREGAGRVLLGRHRGEAAAARRRDRRRHRDGLVAAREQAAHRRDAAREHAAADREQGRLQGSVEAAQARPARADARPAR